ncbi:hypothetical protein TL18_04635 [Methanobrevibacter sp. YE315]|uniref:zinc ribbon domain-containing protein n=1 Tax=Methanobrevibacter sp. YE315 TaxID=1609968 RepID=UPI000764DE40|nr:zinc ribbon domain-containing protein [Methanobrevibacter sp. YE315]AMD17367.1 hypothetical protein TL18_04635 [Methanobrevibacter sp. YE315]
MNSLEELKSEITYENKTIFGVVGIIVGFLFWAIGHPAIGIGDVLILIFPCIFLIIPNQTIKNSKALAIISIVILLLFLLVGISSLFITVTDYMPSSYMFYDGYVETMLLADILQLILCIYGLFCAFLLTIPTEPEQAVMKSFNNNTIKNSGIKYDKYCSECGHGLINNPRFCPGCGTKLIDFEE